MKDPVRNITDIAEETGFRTRTLFQPVYEEVDRKITQGLSERAAAAVKPEERRNCFGWEDCGMSG